MAHPQPSPPGGVPHHGHLAAHPQVNGHMPVSSQAPKGPPLTTAQKIAALNEQVWLQIGKCAPSTDRVDWSRLMCWCRQLDGVDGRPGWRNDRV
jgi:hypothetical protein